MSRPAYEEACSGFDWGAVIADLGWADAAPINLGHTIVDRHADAHRVALYWVARHGAVTTVTYRELKRLSDKVAGMLRGLGVRQGDRVAGVLPRTVETIAVMIGTWKAGGIYVPIFTGFGPDAIAFRLANCDAKVVCTHHEYRKRLPDQDSVTVVTIAGNRGVGLERGDVSFWQAVASEPDRSDPAPCSREDPAVILYTSGSTGEPKGVPIAGNFLAAIRPYMRFGVDLQPTDIFWPTGDPGWGYGFVCYHVALSMGIPVISWEATPTADSFLGFLEAQKVTNLATVPTLLRGVMALGAEAAAGRELALRCISSCGEPLNSEVIRFFQETLGITPRDQFGSSENGLPLGNFNAIDSAVKPGSMGLPMPGFEMAVVDGDGNEVAPGEVGYLAQRPSRDGYYCARLLEGFRAHPGAFSQQLDQGRRPRETRRQRIFLVRGSRRRRDQEFRLSHRSVRGGERDPASSGGRRGGRGRHAGSAAGTHRQGLRDAAAGQDRGARPRRGNPGRRPKSCRQSRLSARGRVFGQSAEDRNQERSSGSSCAADRSCRMGRALLRETHQRRCDSRRWVSQAQPILQTDGERLEGGKHADLR